MAKRKSKGRISPEDILKAKDRISASQAHQEFFTTHTIDAVYKWMQDRQLSAVKVGRKWFTTRSLCRDYLDGLIHSRAERASTELAREGC